MTSVQIMLDEIAKRYDEAYADRVWLLTQEKLETYPPTYEMAVVCLFQVMDEEGFSPSERGAILAAVLEHLTGQSLSPKAREEILDMPVYGTSSFSPEVKEELRSISHSGPQL